MIVVEMRDVLKSKCPTDGSFTMSLLSLTGIVVEDCLLLLLNLLKNNSSNQNFFKEAGFIQKLTPFFELEPVAQSPQGGWSAQKVTNIHLMLQVKHRNVWCHVSDTCREKLREREREREGLCIYSRHLYMQGGEHISKCCPWREFAGSCSVLGLKLTKIHWTCWIQLKVL